MLTQTRSLLEYLTQLAHRQATGELVINAGGTAEPWKIYLYSGRLIYATGGRHPVRRWYRAFKRHTQQPVSDWLPQMQIPGDYWEVDYLNQAIQQRQVSLAQAKAIVQSIVSEVMFALVDRSLKAPQWHPNRLVSQQAAFLSVKQVLHHAQHSHQQCRQASLGLPVALSQIPDLSLVLQDAQALKNRVSAKGYEQLSSWLQGTSTLWDITTQTRRPISNVLRLLLPLAQQGIVELMPIPDLAAPYKPAAPLPTAPSPAKGLIACIDDSPTVCKTMAQLLQPMGYEVLPITQPLQQISTLLKHKPDMIFLDLMMPHINGYELCSFLRKTSAFQTTPIVILTGKDGVIDRVRTKIVGSSDFLAKPPDQKKVAQIIQKYLS